MDGPALLFAMLGACSGGSDKAAAEKVDEKPRVKLADVSSRPVEQIQEYRYGGSRSKNNIAPSSPVRIDRIFGGSGRPRVERPEAGQHGCCQSEADKISAGQPGDEFKRMDELYKSRRCLQIGMGYRQNESGHP